MHRRSGPWRLAASQPMTSGGGVGIGEGDVARSLECRQPGPAELDQLFLCRQCTWPQHDVRDDVEIIRVQDYVGQTAAAPGFLFPDSDAARRSDSTD